MKACYYEFSKTLLGDNLVEIFFNGKTQDNSEQANTTRDTCITWFTFKGYVWR